MVMFFTEDRAMKSINAGCVAVVVVACLAPLLSGCTQSSLRISPDFGNAVNQDIAAQIADPDAHYAGTPAPGSSGLRVDLAQRRYDTGQVIQPSSTTASSGASIGTADNGANGAPGAGAGGGAGASAGAGVGMSQ
jgi:hypothetical protein